LEAVKTIHEERIVHSDLKPANFSLVKGELKLIDFGITKAGQNYTTNIVWESQMGIVKYMSLEAYLNNTTNDSGNKSKIA
jgi:serine/threonine-protein kinase TTK/MPS1